MNKTRGKFTKPLITTTPLLEQKSKFKLEPQGKDQYGSKY